MNKQPETMAASRRSFLAKAAVGAPAMGALAVLAAGRPAFASNGHKLTGFAATLIREIQNDENAHVPILQNLLDDKDNPLPVPIRRQPTLRLDKLRQPNLTAFLQTAAEFENTGSGVYGGILIAVTQTPEYFPTAVGLCTVESRHAGWLNSLLGQSLVPDFLPVESAVSQSVTLSRVAGFVSDHRSTFPSFDPVNASDANNFRILDFLLFLEYIESAFYDVNVPRFT